MHIDSYRHGRMVIDGRPETRDLILLGDEVKGNWWRAEGHVLSPDDLVTVWEHQPERLIVGTGSTGLMQPSPLLAGELARRGIELEVMPTADAVERFNELSKDHGIDVAAAFHLTC
ncbi:MAG: MTH938/NDUFAF3 family protein [Acidimicrobiia bacterium]